MRLFISINIPNNIKDILYRRIEPLQDKINRDIRWVKNKNWHITLKFLGDVEEKNIEYIKDKMIVVAKNNRQQSINFSKIAAFPDLETPRILYIGVCDNNGGFKKLYNDMESQLNGKRGSYVPHLTIGRIKSKRNRINLPYILKNFQKQNLSDINIKVEKISLMQSILKSNGPEYRELYFANLKENMD